MLKEIISHKISKTLQVANNAGVHSVSQHLRSKGVLLYVELLDGLC
jgi:transcriptional regulator of NAD metabolism